MARGAVCGVLTREAEGAVGTGDAVVERFGVQVRRVGARRTVDGLGALGARRTVLVLGTVFDVQGRGRSLEAFVPCWTDVALCSIKNLIAVRVCALRAWLLCSCF